MLDEYRIDTISGRAGSALPTRRGIRLLRDLGRHQGIFSGGMVVPR
jgi:hypothetical protein